MVANPTQLQDARPFLYGDCDLCPLSRRVVRGYGVGEGIAVVGESPGPQEVSKGRPFIGPSGQLLRQTLKMAGVDPEEDVYYTNSVLCHSPNKPTKDAIVSCNQRLRLSELGMVQPKKILAVGAVAAQALLSPSKSVAISKVRGRGFWYQYGRQSDGSRLRAYVVATWHPSAVLRVPDYFRDFSGDIRKLVTHDAPMEDQLDVKLLTKPERALKAIQSLYGWPKLACDIETTGFNVKQDIILSVGISYLRDGERDGVCYVIPGPVLKSQDVSDALAALIQNHPYISFHNQKFDLAFLSRDLRTKFRGNNIRDTMLLHYALDERSGGDQGTGGKNRGKQSVHGLKDLARFYCDAEDYAYIVEFLKKPEHTKEDFLNLFYYQAQDCYYTSIVDVELSRKLETAERGGFRGTELLNNLLLPGAKVISEIESHGMLVDKPYLEAFAVEKADLVNIVRERIIGTVQKVTGIRNFNPASIEQVRGLIYDEWRLPRLVDPYNRKNKEPATKEILEKLADLTIDPDQESILKDIVDWRAAAKLFRTYAVGFLSQIRPDGRLQPSFSLHGTSTGRMSCAKPNLQNVPNKIGPALEWAFVAPEGYSIVAADYSQLELRVLAYYCADPALCDIFYQGKDIHGETSVKIFHKPIDQITKLERTMTKTMVFGVVYGRGPESILKGKEIHHLVSQTGATSWTVAEAQEFQESLHRAYPGIRRWMATIHRLALTEKYAETATGRRRRFPLILNENREEIKRQAGNSPIQGLASDICLNAIIILHDELPEGAYILNNIHDAILFEVRNDLLPTVIPQIRNTMERRLPILTDIPFKVVIKVGPRWGAVEEWKNDAVAARV